MKKKITTITVDDEAPGMNVFWDAVARLGAQELTVRKGGRAIKLATKDAVMEKLAETALKGSPQSIRQYNELQRIAAENKQRDIDKSVVRWRAFKHRQLDLYAQHIKEHGCELLNFPHPEDIIIDERDGVRIVGPINHDEYIAMRHTRRVIDACLWQGVLDRRTSGWRQMTDPKAGHFS